MQRGAGMTGGQVELCDVMKEGQTGLKRRFQSTDGDYDLQKFFKRKRKKDRSTAAEKGKAMRTFVPWG